MVDTYIGSNIEARYFVHSALQSAFIEPRSIYKEASGGKITAFHRAEGFAKISTTAHMCDWIKFRLPHGLFHTDQRDGWGSVAIFNRVAGGIAINANYQDWQNDTAQYESQVPYQPLPFLSTTPELETVEASVQPRRLELNIRSKIIDRVRQGFQGGEERKVNFTALLEADVSSLTYGVCGWQPRPSQTPGDPAYDPMQAMLLEKAVKIAHFREVDEWVEEVEAFTPEEAEPAERVLRSLKISLIFYNHNYNQYVQGTFLFDMKLSGQVKPFYAFRPFNLDPPTGSPNQGAEFLRSVFRRVRLWLVLVNTGMVLLRTFNEVKTCISIFRKTRSCLAYFGGVYTILELFNLTCNYIGVVFRIYSILLNQRIGIEDLISNDNPEDVIETMGEPIALIEGVIVTARALSIISAMLLLFKYLELAPRRALPAVYLTGTTLGRAGRDLQMTFFCFLTLLLAFAITGEQLFGTTVEEFSSIPMAFFTLSICVSGSGAIYRKLAIYYPTMGPLYFVVFTMTHLVLVTPLFLATLNDAYSVRDEQMQLQAERKAAKEEARRLKKEKERKKQMM